MASKYHNISLDISSLACNTDQPIKMCAYKTHDHVERQREYELEIIESGFGDKKSIGGQAVALQLINELSHASRKVVSLSLLFKQSIHTQINNNTLMLF